MKQAVLCFFVLAFVAIVSAEELPANLSEVGPITPAVHWSSPWSRSWASPWSPSWSNPWSRYALAQDPSVGLPVGLPIGLPVFSPAAASPWITSQLAGWPSIVMVNGVPVPLPSADIRGLQVSDPIALPRRSLLSYLNPMIANQAAFFNPLLG